MAYHINVHISLFKKVAKMASFNRQCHCRSFPRHRRCAELRPPRHGDTCTAAEHIRVTPACPQSAQMWPCDVTWQMYAYFWFCSEDSNSGSSAAVERGPSRPTIPCLRPTEGCKPATKRERMAHSRQRKITKGSPTWVKWEVSLFLQARKGSSFSCHYAIVMKVQLVQLDLFISFLSEICSVT